VTILNSLSVSSSEPEARSGIKSCKAYLLSSAEQQEAIGDLYISNKQRIATLHLDSEFYNF
jgi:hypothetical protein